MKKLALAALTLSSLTFATSIRNTAAELVDSPLHYDTDPATIIRVAADGEVFGAKCDVLPTRKVVLKDIDYKSCKWTTVKVFTRYEIKKFNDLVKQAKSGKIVLPRPDQFHCMAIPSRAYKYTSANGTKLLQSGSYPCGSVTYNDAPAARELVKWLQELKAEYETLVD